VPEYLSLFPPVAHTSSDLFKLPFELNAFDFDAYTKVQLFDAIRCHLQSSAKRQIFLTIIQWLSTYKKSAVLDVMLHLGEAPMMLVMCNLRGITFESPHIPEDIRRKFKEFDFSEYRKEQLLQALKEALSPVLHENSILQEVSNSFRNSHMVYGSRDQVPSSVIYMLDSMLQKAQAAERTRPAFGYDQALGNFIKLMEHHFTKSAIIGYLKHWSSSDLIPVIVQIVKEKPLRPLRFKDTNDEDKEEDEEEEKEKDSRKRFRDATIQTDDGDGGDDEL